MSTRTKKSEQEKFNDRLVKWRTYKKDKPAVDAFVKRAAYRLDILRWLARMGAGPGWDVNFYDEKKNQVYKIASKDITGLWKDESVDIKSFKKIFDYSHKREPTVKKTIMTMTVDDIKGNTGPSMAGPALLDFIKNANFGFDVKQQTPLLWEGKALGPTFLSLFFVYINANTLKRKGVRTRGGEKDVDKDGNPKATNTFFNIEQKEFRNAFGNQPALMIARSNGKDADPADKVLQSSVGSRRTTFDILEDSGVNTAAGQIPTTTVMKIRAANVYPVRMVTEALKKQEENKSRKSNDQIPLSPIEQRLVELRTPNMMQRLLTESRTIYRLTHPARAS